MGKSDDGSRESQTVTCGVIVGRPNYTKENCAETRAAWIRDNLEASGYPGVVCEYGQGCIWRLLAYEGTRCEAKMKVSHLRVGT